MGRQKQVSKSDRWLRDNPLPTTATNELILSWVARYEQEVGSVDQVRRPSQHYIEGGSGWQCGVCGLCFPIPEPTEVHEPQVVREFWTHAQACRVSWLEQRRRQAQMAETQMAVADTSELPLATQLLSPDRDINIQYASLRAMGPQVCEAFNADERSADQTRMLQAAIHIMVVLREMAPFKKRGEGKQKDVAGVRTTIGKLEMPKGDWIEALWKTSLSRKKRCRERGTSAVLTREDGETGEKLRVTKSARILGDVPSPEMKTRVDKPHFWICSSSLLFPRPQVSGVCDPGGSSDGPVQDYAHRTLRRVP